MDDAMKDLGRRAIAAGWRWMPGAKWHVERAAPLEPIVSRCNDHYPRECPWAGALPDFSDPATVGCLLAQVRERWGGIGSGVVCIVPRGLRWVMMTCGQTDAAIWGDTEAAALVAALEAAPKVAP